MGKLRHRKATIYQIHLRTLLPAAAEDQFNESAAICPQKSPWDWQFARSQRDLCRIFLLSHCQQTLKLAAPCTADRLPTPHSTGQVLGLLSPWLVPSKNLLSLSSLGVTAVTGDQPLNAPVRQAASMPVPITGDTHTPGTAAVCWGDADMVPPATWCRFISWLWGDGIGTDGRCLQGPAVQP